MGILTFIGILAVIIFGKFIWDTYLTNNTEQQYQNNKRQNPEEIARMTNNVAKKEYLNFDYSPKSVPMHKALSLVSLANKYDCSPDEVKALFQADYLEFIRVSCASDTEAIALLATSIAEARDSKAGEAVKAVIDPDDTQAAIVEEWLLEIEAVISASRLKLAAEDEQEVELPPTSGVFVHEIQKTGERYKVTFQQRVNGKYRRVSEWLSEEIVLGKPDGEGLHVGHEISGWCIRRITSSQQFFEGQQPDSDTELYQKMIMNPSKLGEETDNSDMGPNGGVFIHSIKKHGERYKVTFQQYVDGEERCLSEWLLEVTVLSAFHGEPLYFGQGMSGCGISRLTSDQAFFDGQQPDSVTGLYSRMVLKDLDLGELVTDSVVVGSNKSEREYSLQYHLDKGNGRESDGLNTDVP